jgi:hypothetical protein
VFCFWFFEILILNVRVLLLITDFVREIRVLLWNWVVLFC